MVVEQDLVSVRGLVDSPFDVPYVEFDGVFAGYETEPAKGYDGTRINLNYGELDNVVCVPGQVYNLPTAVINLPLSNAKKSKFGYYGSSLADLEPPDEDLKDWKGQRHHVVLADGQDGRPEPKSIWSKDAETNYKRSIVLLAQIKEAGGDSDAIEALKAELEGLGVIYPKGDVPTPVWVVTSVDGASSPSGESIADYAEEHVIGLTRAEFNKWAYSDSKIRKDIAFQRSVTDKSFITSLIQLGRVEENEDGVFQKPV